MNSLPTKAKDSFDWATAWRGWWIFFVWIGIHTALQSLAFEGYVERFLDGPEFRITTGPPFHSIHENIIEGICAAIGLVAAFALTWLTWNYSPIFSLLVRSMSLVICGSNAAFALYVWLQCDGLFTPNARCPWPTFDAYIGDPWQMRVFHLSLGVATVYATWGIWKLSKRYRFNRCWVRNAPLRTGRHESRPHVTEVSRTGSLPVCGGDSSDWRSSIRGWWILCVWLVIQATSMTAAFGVMDILDNPELGIRSDSPLGFIHDDVIQGIFAVIGLAAMFSLTCLTWNYAPFYSFMAQICSICQLGHRAVPALYLWLRCDALFTPNARCPWPTYDAYRHDPGLMFAIFMPMSVGLSYGIWWIARLYKQYAQSSLQQSS